MSLPTVAQLVADAACFSCLDKKTQMTVQTYLIAATANATAGTSMDPATLVDLSRCFACLTEEQHLQIQTLLLCQILEA